MDQTTYSGRLAVPHGDDAPFADERYRYLRHCAEGGATAASLKIKRNELLWIAARLGPDASEGIDIEALQRIATQRQCLHGAVTAARRARIHAIDGGAMEPDDRQVPALVRPDEPATQGSYA